MAYLINNYDGTPLVNVQDRTLNITTTSLKLPGRDYRPYGETMVENLIYMLQHFAQGVPPQNPIGGQIWFDTTLKQVRVYDSSTEIWLPVGAPQTGTDLPTQGSAGQLFYNSVKRQLFVWDSGAIDWRLVGPIGAFDNLDNLDPLVPPPVPNHSAWEVVQILDASIPTPVLRTVWRLVIAGTLVAIVARESFNAGINGFTDPIQTGINLRNTFRFVGQASSAVTASTAVTLPIGDSSNSIATTAFVTNTFANKANVSGNPLQLFEVASAVTNTQAVNLGQLLSAIPTGVIQEYAGATAPPGWLLCDGSEVGRNTYPTLWNLIGTAYGAGNGSTTFNLPDRRGKFGLGASGSYPLGSTGGSMTSGGTSLSVDQIPSHSHTGTTSTAGDHSHSVFGTLSGGPGLGSGGTSSFPQTSSTSVNGSHTHSFTTDSTGSGATHNHTVTPPYLVLNYIIKT